ncbi:uncharacterized protein LOC100210173 isoform X3 [Hydra vulgaris]|uniref:Uncharacterized protein LOC100210173 isoform X3 n=1 Tax=Hydra vulgaris TaxID=6087 RepID=A0ABM4C8B8_HYDVU
MGDPHNSFQGAKKFSYTYYSSSNDAIDWLKANSQLLLDILKSPKDYLWQKCSFVLAPGDDVSSQPKWFQTSKTFLNHSCPIDEQLEVTKSISYLLPEDCVLEDGSISEITEYTDIICKNKVKNIYYIVSKANFGTGYSIIQDFLITHNLNTGAQSCLNGYCIEFGSKKKKFREDLENILRSYQSQKKSASKILYLSKSLLKQYEDKVVKRLNTRSVYRRRLSPNNSALKLHQNEDVKPKKRKVISVLGVQINQNYLRDASLSPWSHTKKNIKTEMKMECRQFFQPVEQNLAVKKNEDLDVKNSELKRSFRKRKIEPENLQFLGDDNLFRKQGIFKTNNMSNGNINCEEFTDVFETSETFEQYQENEDCGSVIEACSLPKKPLKKKLFSKLLTHQDQPSLEADYIERYHSKPFTRISSKKSLSLNSNQSSAYILKPYILNTSTKNKKDKRPFSLKKKSFSIEPVLHESFEPIKDLSCISITIEDKIVETDECELANEFLNNADKNVDDDNFILVENSQKLKMLYCNFLGTLSGHNTQNQVIWSSKSDAISNGKSFIDVKKSKLSVPLLPSKTIKIKNDVSFKETNVLQYDKQKAQQYIINLDKTSSNQLLTKSYQNKNNIDDDFFVVDYNDIPHRNSELENSLEITPGRVLVEDENGELKSFELSIEKSVDSIASNIFENYVVISVKDDKNSDQTYDNFESSTNSSYDSSYNLQLFSPNTSSKLLTNSGHNELNNNLSKMKDNKLMGELPLIKSGEKSFSFRQMLQTVKGEKINDTYIKDEDMKPEGMFGKFNLNAKNKEKSNNVVAVETREIKDQLKNRIFLKLDIDKENKRFKKDNDEEFVVLEEEKEEKILASESSLELNYADNKQKDFNQNLESNLNLLKSSPGVYKFVYKNLEKKEGINTPNDAMQQNDISLELGAVHLLNTEKNQTMTVVVNNLNTTEDMKDDIAQDIKRFCINYNAHFEYFIIAQEKNVGNIVLFIKEFYNDLRRLFVGVDRGIIGRVVFITEYVSKDENPHFSIDLNSNNAQKVIDTKSNIITKEININTKEKLIRAIVVQYNTNTYHEQNSKVSLSKDFINLNNRETSLKIQIKNDQDKSNESLLAKETVRKKTRVSESNGNSVFPILEPKHSIRYIPSVEFQPVFNDDSFINDTDSNIQSKEINDELDLNNFVLVKKHVKELFVEPEVIFSKKNIVNNNVFDESVFAKETVEKKLKISDSKSIDSTILPVFEPELSVGYIPTVEFQPVFDDDSFINDTDSDIQSKEIKDELAVSNFIFVKENNKSLIVEPEVIFSKENNVNNNVFDESVLEKETVEERLEISGSKSINSTILPVFEPELSVGYIATVEFQPVFDGDLFINDTDSNIQSNEIKDELDVSNFIFVKENNESLIVEPEVIFSKENIVNNNVFDKSVLAKETIEKKLEIPDSKSINSTVLPVFEPELSVGYIPTVEFPPVFDDDLFIIDTDSNIQSKEIKDELDVSNFIFVKENNKSLFVEPEVIFSKENIVNNNVFDKSVLAKETIEKKLEIPDSKSINSTILPVFEPELSVGYIPTVEFQPVFDDDSFINETYSNIQSKEVKDELDVSNFIFVKENNKSLIVEPEVIFSKENIVNNNVFDKSVLAKETIEKKLEIPDSKSINSTILPVFEPELSVGYIPTVEFQPVFDDDSFINDTDSNIQSKEVKDELDVSNFIFVKENNKSLIVEPEVIFSKENIVNNNVFDKSVLAKETIEKKLEIPDSKSINSTILPVFEPELSVGYIPTVEFQPVFDDDSFINDTDSNIQSKEVKDELDVSNFIFVKENNKSLIVEPEVIFSKENIVNNNVFDKSVLAKETIEKKLEIPDSKSINSTILPVFEPELSVGYIPTVEFQPVFDDDSFINDTYSNIQSKEIKDKLDVSNFIFVKENNKSLFVEPEVIFCKENNVNNNVFDESVLAKETVEKRLEIPDSKSINSTILPVFEPEQSVGYIATVEFQPVFNDDLFINDTDSNIQSKEIKGELDLNNFVVVKENVTELFVESEVIFSKENIVNNNVFDEPVLVKETVEKKLEIPDSKSIDSSILPVSEPDQSIGYITAVEFPPVFDDDLFINDTDSNIQSKEIKDELDVSNFIFVKEKNKSLFVEPEVIFNKENKVNNNVFDESVLAEETVEKKLEIPDAKSISSTILPVFEPEQSVGFIATVEFQPVFNDDSFINDTDSNIQLKEIKNDFDLNNFGLVKENVKESFVKPEIIFSSVNAINIKGIDESIIGKEALEFRISSENNSYIHHLGNISCNSMPHSDDKTFLSNNLISLDSFISVSKDNLENIVDLSFSESSSDDEDYCNNPSNIDSIDAGEDADDDGDSNDDINEFISADQSEVDEHICYKNISKNIDKHVNYNDRVFISNDNGDNYGRRIDRKDQQIGLSGFSFPQVFIRKHADSPIMDNSDHKDNKDIGVTKQISQMNDVLKALQFNLLGNNTSSDEEEFIVFDQTEKEFNVPQSDIEEHGNEECEFVNADLIPLQSTHSAWLLHQANESVDNNVLYGYIEPIEFEDLTTSVINEVEILECSIKLWATEVFEEEILEKVNEIETLIADNYELCNVEILESLTLKESFVNMFFSENAAVQNFTIQDSNYNKKAGTLHTYGGNDDSINWSDLCSINSVQVVNTEDIPFNLCNAKTLYCDVGTDHHDDCKNCDIGTDPIVLENVSFLNILNQEKSLNNDDDGNDENNFKSSEDNKFKSFEEKKLQSFEEKKVESFEEKKLESFEDEKLESFEDKKLESIEDKKLESFDIVNVQSFEVEKLKSTEKEKMELFNEKRLSSTVVEMLESSLKENLESNEDKNLESTAVVKLGPFEVEESKSFKKEKLEPSVEKFESIISDDSLLEVKQFKPAEKEDIELSEIEILNSSEKEMSESSLEKKCESSEDKKLVLSKLEIDSLSVVEMHDSSIVEKLGLFKEEKPKLFEEETLDTPDKEKLESSEVKQLRSFEVDVLKSVEEEKLESSLEEILESFKVENVKLFKVQMFKSIEEEAFKLSAEQMLELFDEEALNSSEVEVLESSLKEKLEFSKDDTFESTEEVKLESFKVEKAKLIEEKHKLSDAEKLVLFEAEMLRLSDTEKPNFFDTEKLVLSETEMFKLSDTEKLMLSETEMYKLSDVEKIVLSDTEKLELSQVEQLRSFKIKSLKLSFTEVEPCDEEKLEFFEEDEVEVFKVCQENKELLKDRENIENLEGKFLKANENTKETNTIIIQVTSRHCNEVIVYNVRNSKGFNFNNFSLLYLPSKWFEKNEWTSVAELCEGITESKQRNEELIYEDIPHDLNNCIKQKFHTKEIAFAVYIAPEEQVPDFHKISFDEINNEPKLHTKEIAFEEVLDMYISPEEQVPDFHESFFDEMDNNEPISEKASTKDSEIHSKEFTPADQSISKVSPTDVSLYENDKILRGDVFLKDVDDISRDEVAPSGDVIIVGKLKIPDIFNNQLQTPEFSNMQGIESSPSSLKLKPEFRDGKKSNKMLLISNKLQNNLPTEEMDEAVNVQFIPENQIIPNSSDDLCSNEQINEPKLHAKEIAFEEVLDVYITPEQQVPDFNESFFDEMDNNEPISKKASTKDSEIHSKEFTPADQSISKVSPSDVSFYENDKILRGDVFLKDVDDISRDEVAPSGDVIIVGKLKIPDIFNNQLQTPEFSNMQGIESSPSSLKLKPEFRDGKKSNKMLLISNKLQNNLPTEEMDEAVNVQFIPENQIIPNSSDDLCSNEQLNKEVALNVEKRPKGQIHIDNVELNVSTKNNFLPQNVISPKDEGVLSSSEIRVGKLKIPEVFTENQKDLKTPTKNKLKESTGKIFELTFSNEDGFLKPIDPTDLTETLTIKTEFKSNPENTQNKNEVNYLNHFKPNGKRFSKIISSSTTQSDLMLPIVPEKQISNLNNINEDQKKSMVEINNINEDQKSTVDINKNPLKKNISFDLHSNNLVKKIQKNEIEFEEIVDVQLLPEEQIPDHSFTSMDEEMNKDANETSIKESSSFTAIKLTDNGLKDLKKVNDNVHPCSIIKKETKDKLADSKIDDQTMNKPLKDIAGTSINEVAHSQYGAASKNVFSSENETKVEKLDIPKIFQEIPDSKIPIKDKTDETLKTKPGKISELTFSYKDGYLSPFKSMENLTIKRFKTEYNSNPEDTQEKNECAVNYQLSSFELKDEEFSKNISLSRIQSDLILSVVPEKQISNIKNINEDQKKSMVDINNINEDQKKSMVDINKSSTNKNKSDISFDMHSNSLVKKIQAKEIEFKEILDVQLLPEEQSPDNSFTSKDKERNKEVLGEKFCLKDVESENVLVSIETKTEEKFSNDLHKVIDHQNEQIVYLSKVGLTKLSHDTKKVVDLKDKTFAANNAVGSFKDEFNLSEDVLSPENKTKDEKLKISEFFKENAQDSEVDGIIKPIEPADNFSITRPNESVVSLNGFKIKDKYISKNSMNGIQSEFILPDKSVPEKQDLDVANKKFDNEKNSKLMVNKGVLKNNSFDLHSNSLFKKIQTKEIEFEEIVDVMLMPEVQLQNDSFDTFDQQPKKEALSEQDPSSKFEIISVVKLTPNEQPARKQSSLLDFNQSSTKPICDTKNECNSPSVMIYANNDNKTVLKLDNQTKVHNSVCKTESSAVSGFHNLNNNEPYIKKQVSLNQMYPLKDEVALNKDKLAASKYNTIFPKDKVDSKEGINSVEKINVGKVPDIFNENQVNEIPEVKSPMMKSSMMKSPMMKPYELMFTNDIGLVKPFETGENFAANDLNDSSNILKRKEENKNKSNEIQSKINAELNEELNNTTDSSIKLNKSDESLFLKEKNKFKVKEIELEEIVDVQLVPEEEVPDFFFDDFKLLEKQNNNNDDDDGLVALQDVINSIDNAKVQSLLPESPRYDQNIPEELFTLLKLEDDTDSDDSLELDNDIDSCRSNNDSSDNDANFEVKKHDASVLNYEQSSYKNLINDNHTSSLTPEISKDLTSSLTPEIKLASFNESNKNDQLVEVSENDEKDEGNQKELLEKTGIESRSSSFQSILGFQLIHCTSPNNEQSDESESSSDFLSENSIESNDKLYEQKNKMALNQQTKIGIEDKEPDDTKKYKKIFHPSDKVAQWVVAHRELDSNNDHQNVESVSVSPVISFDSSFNKELNDSDQVVNISKKRLCADLFLTRAKSHESLKFQEFSKSNDFQTQNSEQDQNKHFSSSIHYLKLLSSSVLSKELNESCTNEENFYVDFWRQVEFIEDDVLSQNFKVNKSLATKLTNEFKKRQHNIKNLKSLREIYEKKDFLIKYETKNFKNKIGDDIFSNKDLWLINELKVSSNISKLTYEQPDNFLYRIPLSHKSIVSVDAKRVASYIIKLKNQQNNGNSFEEFKQNFSGCLCEEEIYFVYLYLFRKQKWFVVAEMCNQMYRVKMVSKNSKIVHKSVLSEEDIENQFATLANQEKEYNIEDSSYLALNESIDKILLKVANMRSDPVIIGKWFIILNAFCKESICTFNEFLQTYSNLNQLTMYQKFLVYLLISRKWKVLLDDNKQVFFVPTKNPYYLLEQEEQIEINEARKAIIYLAINDASAFAYLTYLGFILPDVEDSFSNGFLPEHLSHWETCLAHEKPLNITLNEFEHAFPDVQVLSDEEKLLLYSYYSGYDWSNSHACYDWLDSQALYNNLITDDTTNDVHMISGADINIKNVWNSKVKKENLKQTYSYEGDILDIMIDPFEMLEYILVIDTNCEINSFENFKTKYLLQMSDATDKLLYALYCYYYCYSLWKLLFYLPNQDTFIDVEVKRLQLPHPTVIPRNLYKLLILIESTCNGYDISTLDDFKLSFPPVFELNTVEVYLLYCFFCGRKIILGSCSHPNVKLKHNHQNNIEKIKVLPDHLRQWETRLLHEKPGLTQSHFELTYPETQFLSDNDKSLLFDYYCRNFSKPDTVNSSIRSKDNFEQFSYESFSTYPQVGMIDFQLLDSAAEPNKNQISALYSMWAYPEEISELIETWASSSKPLVENFEQFKFNFSGMVFANEFDRFIVYALIYKQDKWMTVVERKRGSNQLRLRLLPRNILLDSNNFFIQFEDLSLVNWLETINNEVELNELLKSSSFSISFGYVLFSYTKVMKLPCSLKHLEKYFVDKRLKHGKLKFEEFVEYFSDVVQSFTVGIQQVLYVYYQEYQQWELALWENGDIIHIHNENNENANKTSGNSIDYNYIDSCNPPSLKSAEDISQNKYTNEDKSIIDMMINPFEMTKWILLIDTSSETNSFEDFKTKYLLQMSDATDKQLYALYCYYYCDCLWKLLFYLPNQDKIIESETKKIQLPHPAINPSNLYKLLIFIENVYTDYDVSTLDNFKSFFPQVQELNLIEMYLLYCFFCGRKIILGSCYHENTNLTGYQGNQIYSKNAQGKTLVDEKPLDFILNNFEHASSADQLLDDVGWKEQIDMKSDNEIFFKGGKSSNKISSSELNTLELEQLDVIEELPEYQLSELFSMWAYPYAVAELLEIWASSSNLLIENFKQFKMKFSGTVSAKEFDWFVVYTLVYRPDKWMTVVERKIDSNQLRLRIIPRNISLDSNSFFIQFEDLSLYNWLETIDNEGELNELLRNSLFLIPSGYTLSSTIKVFSLPYSLLDFEKYFADKTHRKMNFSEFLVQFSEVQDFSLREQQILYVYYQAYKQWELTILKNSVNNDKKFIKDIYHEKSNQSNEDFVKNKVSIIANATSIKSTENVFLNKYTYQGNILDIMINPFEMAEWILLIDTKCETKSFEDFKEKYLSCMMGVTDKHLFALYCYYYCLGIWKIMISFSHGDAKSDLNIYEKVNQFEIPHTSVLPENILKWVCFIEEKSDCNTASTIDNFKSSFPEINSLNQSEIYLLFCFFCGRKIFLSIKKPKSQAHLSRLGLGKGIKVPDDSYQINLLPNHLRNWESILAQEVKICLSLSEFENAFPDIQQLSDADKFILFDYYRSRTLNEESVSIKHFQNQISLEQNQMSPKYPDENCINFKMLDLADELTETQYRTLSLMHTELESIGELLTMWAFSPKLIIDSFEEFSKWYLKWSSATEFQKFVVYALIYRQKKWICIVEKNSKSNQLFLKILLRNVPSDSKEFLIPFESPNLVEWSGKINDDKEIDKYLKLLEFSIPLNYSLSRKLKASHLPNVVNIHLQITNKDQSLKEFLKEFSEVIKNFPTEVQHLLFFYYHKFEEWEFSVWQNKTDENIVPPQSPAIRLNGSKRLKESRHFKGPRKLKASQNLLGSIKKDKKNEQNKERKTVSRKVSYAGKIKDIALDHSQMKSKVPIFDIESENVKTFVEFKMSCENKFKEKLSKKQLYALYCYNFCFHLWKLQVNFLNTDTLLDIKKNIVIEHPHPDVEIANILKWIKLIEQNGIRQKLTTMNEFVSYFPEMKELSEAEIYLLYCFFCGIYFRAVFVPKDSDMNVESKANQSVKKKRINKASPPINNLNEKPSWKRAITLPKLKLSDSFDVSDSESKRKSFNNAMNDHLSPLSPVVEYDNVIEVLNSPKQKDTYVPFDEISDYSIRRLTNIGFAPIKLNKGNNSPGYSYELVPFENVSDYTQRRQTKVREPYVVTKYHNVKSQEDFPEEESHIPCSIPIQDNSHDDKITRL